MILHTYKQPIYKYVARYAWIWVYIPRRKLGKIHPELLSCFFREWRGLRPCWSVCFCTVSLLFSKDVIPYYLYNKTKFWCKNLPTGSVQGIVCRWHGYPEEGVIITVWQNEGRKFVERFSDLELGVWMWRAWARRWCGNSEYGIMPSPVLPRFQFLKVYSLRNTYLCWIYSFEKTTVRRQYQRRFILQRKKEGRKKRKQGGKVGKEGREEEGGREGEKKNKAKRWNPSAILSNQTC